MRTNSSIIAIARKSFHDVLVSSGVLSLSKDGVASNADASNVPSKALALAIAKRIGAKVSPKLPAQTFGSLFESAVCGFLKATFPKLQHLRPGEWCICNLGNHAETQTASFAQYSHLSYLAEVMRREKQLSTVLGNDYMVAPDIVISRALCTDEVINTHVSDAENLNPAR